MLTFDFPTLPPPTNHAYKIVNVHGHGRLALTPEAKAWKQQARLIAQTQANDQPPLTYCGQPAQYVEIEWQIGHPHILRRDYDGVLKLAQDVIAQVIGINDNRIVAFRGVKQRGPERLIIRVTSARLEEV